MAWAARHLAARQYRHFDRPGRDDDPRPGPGWPPAVSLAGLPGGASHQDGFGGQK